MLALIELYKHKYGVKISTRYIRGNANISADFLSRGVVPTSLKNFGIKCECNLSKIADQLDNPLSAWKNEYSSGHEQDS